MAGQAINSYRDLRVRQEAMDLAVACYRVSRGLPKEETFGLTAQIRRAAASVPANVAEGHGRENTGAFIQYLRISQGSLKELETHLLLAERVQLLKRAEIEAPLRQCDGVGKMLRSLIRSLQRKEKV
ncbi:MAG: four helix bundle protein [Hyphomicrobiales bacterium]|nr:four helix bundle protein [Hyphomicrobiales bacterium]